MRGDGVALATCLKVQARRNAAVSAAGPAASRRRSLDLQPCNRIKLRTLAGRFVGRMGLHIDPQCCIDEPLVLCALILKLTKKQRIDMERHLSKGSIRRTHGCLNEERIVEEWTLGSVDLSIRERCDLSPVGSGGRCRDAVAHGWLGEQGAEGSVAARRPFASVPFLLRPAWLSRPLIDLTILRCLILA